MTISPLASDDVQNTRHTELCSHIASLFTLYEFSWNVHQNESEPWKIQEENRSAHNLSETKEKQIENKTWLMSFGYKNWNKGLPMERDEIVKDIVLSIAFIYLFPTKPFYVTKMQKIFC